MFKKITVEEIALILIICCGFSIAYLFLYPATSPASWRVDREARDLLILFAYSSVAFAVAFPLTDKLLSKKKYAVFIVATVCIIFAVSFLLSFIIVRYDFNNLPFLTNLYATGGEVVIITMSLLAGRLVLNRYQHDLKTSRLAQVSAETELQYLKQQINPHLLFNSLNNIYSSALQENPATPGLILKLSDILRYAIYDCSADTVDLSREIKYLSEYVEIHGMAVEGRGSVDFSSEGCSLNKRIQPLLLMPFVENAFKHSLDGMDRDIHISIKIKVRHSRLMFLCENSFSEDHLAAVSPELRDGVGLSNVTRRLDLLFDRAYSLRISNKDGMYRVELELPLL